MLLFRIATAFFLSFVNVATAMVGLLLPLLALLLAQLWLPLELRDWPILQHAAALLQSHASTNSATGLLFISLMTWVAIGALFLKYQLHADRRLMAASRDNEAVVDANIRSLPDIVFQTAFLLALGPLVVLVRAFQRPTFAYVSTASHYRDKIFYTAGRQPALEADTKIVFDSKSYLLAQMLELLFWGGVFYLVLFENSMLTL